MGKSFIFLFGCGIKGIMKGQKAFGWKSPEKGCLIGFIEPANYITFHFVISREVLINVIYFSGNICPVHFSFQHCKLFFTIK